MAIEHYMPDFCCGKQIWFDSRKPAKTGNKSCFLVDLDNTLIAWNNPDGDLEMKRDGCMTFVMVNSHYSSLKQF